MTEGKILRVACVGAGYFSQFHYESWGRMPRVRLVGACDRDLPKAQATGLPAFDDLDAMLAKTAPDLLDIILPPDAHAETIRKALAAGVTSIICQKPFCTGLDQANQIIAEADRAGAQIIIHENFRFQPWYRCISSALQRNDIGDIMQLCFRLRPGDGQGPKAYLDRQPYFQTMPRFLIRETGVHWVDTFRYLLGAPVSVYADLRQVNPVIAGEDAGFVIFEHRNGVRALLDGNRCLDHAAENRRRTMGEALVEGSKGTLTLTGNGAVTLRKFGSCEKITLLPPDEHKGFGGDCVHHLQSHVVLGLLDGAPLENLAQDYLAVMHTEAAIYRSAKNGCKLDLEDLQC